MKDSEGFVMLKINIQGHAECTVNDRNTAASVGSGDLHVFSTPYMIALMEEAAQNSVAPELEEGQSTVGTGLSVSHEAATPRGDEGLGGEPAHRDRRPQAHLRGPRL